jgi:hypothetical protein
MFLHRGTHIEERMAGKSLQPVHRWLVIDDGGQATCPQCEARQDLAGLF